MKIRKFIDENWNWLSLLTATTVLAAILLNIYLGQSAPTYNSRNNKDIIEKTIQVLAAKNAIDFDMWYKINMTAHFLLITFGVLATLTAALTTPENMPKIKVWTIIFTSLTAGIGTGLSTFHVHQNLDRFGSIGSQLNTLELQYKVKRGDLSLANKGLYGATGLPMVAGNLSPTDKKKIVLWAWARIIGLERQRLLAYTDVGSRAKGNVPKLASSADNSGVSKNPEPDDRTKKVSGHL